MTYFNAQGQGRVGWRSSVAAPTPVTVSTLLTSLYSVWNGDTTASTLDSSIYGVWNGETLGTSLDTSIYASYNAENNANDSVGTKHGTAQGGLTYTTGKVGNAFQFNGSNAYVQLPNNSFNFTGDFSASLWVNFPSMSFQNCQLIENTCFDTSGAGTSGWRLYYLYGSLGFYNYRENSMVLLESYQLNQANVWYHVVITSSSSGMKIYLNGSLSVSNTTTQRPNYPNTASTRLGASRFNSQFFTGKMDGVTIWNRLLTDDEVTNLYNAGNGVEYPFSSQTLPSAKDAVSTNNGTLMNGCTFATGKIGQAFQFDGVNDYVALPDNSLNLTGDFTISLWIYPTSGAPQSILNSRAFISGSVFKGWYLDINNISGGQSGIITFAIGQGPGSTQYTGWEFRTTPLTLNAWNHVLIKRVSGVNTYCWVNNISQSYVLAGVGANITLDPTYHTIQYNTIGSTKMTSGTVTNYLANGSKVDGLTIWNKSLTEDERTQLYNLGNGTQYPFSGQTLPTSKDAYGTNNGTLMNGCTFATGKIGKAFTFDGVNDLVALPVNSMNFTGDYSFSFFVNLGTVGSSTQTVFASENWTGSGGDRGYIISFINGVLYFDGYYNSTFVVRCISTTTVSANQWYHFTITKTSTQVKMYMNGSLQTTTNYTGVINYNPTVYPAIGALYYQNGTNSYNFMSNGSKIDAFSVWQKELTQAEVTELYNSGNGKQYPNF